MTQLARIFRGVTPLVALAALLTSACASSGGLRSARSASAESASDSDRATLSQPAETKPDESKVPAEAADSPIQLVALPSPGSPIVAIRLQFAAGSIYDPAGKEGLAHLTGLMLGQSATGKRSFKELVDALYPMAASIDVATDREVTVFSGEVHRDTLDEYVGLLLEALLDPAFAKDDFARHKAQQGAFLTNTLRASNDELLGLEAIQQVIFSDHPYGHAPQGTIQGLAAITLDDVRNFYRSHYSRDKLVLGLAGGYPDSLPGDLQAKLASLPAGGQGRGDLDLPSVDRPEGRQFVLIDKPTDSVGIHIGYPLSINRSHPDYYPLMVANSFLGEHRTFHGRLMKQLRGKRGLNYGDYSYIEYWHLPPFTSNPSPNFPRRQQFFSVWIRPVVPNTAHFALRNALYEVDRLIQNGMTQEEFELTRDFVVNYSKLWAQSPSNRLGFAMDSHFYGIDYYIDRIEDELAKLSVEDVNEAIERHIQTDSFHAVFVTAGADKVRSYLEADEPSPMEYNAPPEADVVRADKTIQRIPVEPDAFEIVPVQAMFEGGN